MCRTNVIHNYSISLHDRQLQIKEQKSTQNRPVNVLENKEDKSCSSL